MDNSEMNDIEYFSKLTKDIKFVMFTTQEVNGHELVSRPMTLQQIEFDGDLWFFANKTAEMVNQIKHNSHVNLSFSNPDDMSFLSAKGRAEVVEDRKKAQELWNPSYQAWFEEGLDDPNLCLLKVTVESVDYWESPGSKLVRLASFAASALLGERPDRGFGKHGHLEFNY